MCNTLVHSQPMKLSETQKKYLRGLGHSLKPLILVGDAGLSEGLLAEFESTLAHHELIKVRVNAEGRDARDAMISELCSHSGAELVQGIGNIALLFRRNPDKQRIRIPNH